VSRFEAIGHFVYENGNRIGCTPDEAAVELARKLNAYQMRVERFKAENARLKAEVERLTKAGDAMQYDLKIQVWPWASYFKSIDQWNAAKKGGQP